MFSCCRPQHQPHSSEVAVGFPLEATGEENKAHQHIRHTANTRVHKHGHDRRNFAPHTKAAKGYHRVINPYIG
jgi:hypothetical protein